MSAPPLRGAGRANGPALAAGVAARLLRPVRADTAAVSCDIGWAGPIALPLGDERAVQAACGIMHVHGRASGRPSPLAVDYATATAGVLAAQGVLAALVARSRGTRVSEVRTSVGQAALLSLVQYLAADTTDDGPREPSGRGSATFTSADRVRFECETFEPLHWRRFWQLLGADPRAGAQGWRPFQQRFATATCPLPAALHLAAGRAPFSAVRSAAARARVSVVPVQGDPRPPDVPPFTVTAHHNSGSGSGSGCGLAPVPGPESGAGLREPGRAGAGGTSVRPLEGVRVVESTRRVQGPMAGHILHQLGADVLRIEPPGGDPMRGIPPIAGRCSARFSALNAGKTTTEIDLGTRSGRRAVHELAATADVFVHNWAPGKAAQWQLDSGDLHAAHPGLVYAAASGWGARPPVPPPLGTDYLVQAHSGLGAALRPADEPPAPSLMTLTDLLGGLVCAHGILAALLTRARTGEGARVDSSLLSAAAVLPRPPRRPRYTPLDRPAPTLDGYLQLGPAARTEPRRTARAVGLGASAGPNEILDRLRTRPTRLWLLRLAETGLGATEVCTDLRDLALDPRFSRALATADHALPRAPWEFA
ncbi:CoA transferase [Streptomyces sp. MMBL 11-3]|uniref:CoA transferase n=1 Tax=Streptomyces sp. MMBL 11-3 TaxID=3382639 RepID=UPI0039B544AF